MVRQDVFLLLSFSVIAFLIAHIQSSAAFCDQNCPGSSQNLHLPFPYGFSEGCHIRLNCIKGEVFVGDEFRVQNVTSDGLLINIPPKCNRSIETLKPLYSSNYALTSRNGLFLQNCTTKPKDCVIPESLLRLQFRTTDCEHLYCYTAKVGEERVRNGEGGSFLSFDNITSTGCKFLYSSVAFVVNSMVSLEFRTLHLSYWLNGSCNCSSNANCIEITSPVDQTGGYRCQCVNGYEGDGYAMGRGCLKLKGIHKNMGDSPILKVTLGVGLGFLCFIVATLMICLSIKRRKMKRLKEKKFQQNGGLLLKQKLSLYEGGVEATKIFKAKELELATKNYSDTLILGQGGFGTVYKGILPDGGIVAIKKSKIVDATQIEQFINEIVILTHVNHRNVVKVLGCCLEADVPLLVYEYVPNGTLLQHIHNKTSIFLSWKVRLRIATESAGALAYLHSAASVPIIHRDIKSANILLDENYTAKIADFGVSRLNSLDETQIDTLVKGTLGYLDPEYFNTNLLTNKSDVYSFGVVLLELLTGEKSLTPTKFQEQRSLATYFIDAMERDKLFEIVEPQIANEGTREEIISVAELAMRCLNPKSGERPTMKEVAAELESLSKIETQPSGVHNQWSHEQGLNIHRDERSNLYSVPISSYATDRDSFTSTTYLGNTV